MKNEIKVAVVLVDNVLLSTVLGIEDIFYFINNLIRDESEPILKLTYVSSLKNIKTSNSLGNIKFKYIDKVSFFDIIIIPPIVDSLEYLFKYPKLIEWLNKMHKRGSMLSSVCVGSFLLAQTGLLDNQEATSHWMFEREFKNNFPLVKLNCDKLIVDLGNIVTSGGVNSYLNLVIHILKPYFSSKTLYKCATTLLIDIGKKEQASYKNLTFKLNIKDEKIKIFLNWINQNLREEVSLDLMAKKVNLNKRTFLRRFKSAMGITPKQYQQDLRIEEAKSLLINTKKSFFEITHDVGYFNESSFRRLFKSKTTLNPGEYRKNFSS